MADGRHWRGLSREGRGREGRDKIAEQRQKPPETRTEATTGRCWEGRWVQGSMSRKCCSVPLSVFLCLTSSLALNFSFSLCLSSYPLLSGLPLLRTEALSGLSRLHCPSCLPILLRHLRGHSLQTVVCALPVMLGLCIPASMPTAPFSSCRGPHWPPGL